MGHALFKVVRLPLAKFTSGLLVALLSGAPTVALAQVEATAPDVQQVAAPDQSSSSDTPVLDTTLPGASSDATPANDTSLSADPTSDVVDTPHETADTADTAPAKPDTAPVVDTNDGVNPPMAAMGAGSGNISPTIPAPNVLSLQNAQPRVDGTTGALTFRIPLDIPPGRNGLQPDIALVYNSQNTQDGIVGYGWDVSIPSIVRLNKTGSQNLYSAGYFSSTLDGELATSSTGVYRGRVDESRRTYSFSGNTWTVYDKNGTRYLFGSASQSQLAATTSPSNVYRWMLDEIRDTNDNYVSFTYSRDGNQLYPDTITYTGHGASDGIFTVVFTKSSRPDPYVDYRPGFRVTTSYRITQIRANVNGSMVRQYALGYTSGNNGSRSLLNSIQQDGNGDSGTTTLPPLTFNYLSSTTAFVAPAPTPVAGAAYIPTDLNGNGINDTMVAWSYLGNNQGTFVPDGSGSGSSITPADYWAAASTPGDPYVPIERGTRLVDINADGKADIVRGYSNYTTASSSVYAIYLNTFGPGVYTWTATSTGTTTVPQIDYDGSGSVANLTTGIFSDANGDGLPDYLERVDGYSPVTGAYFGTGSGWTALSTTTFSPAKSFPALTPTNTNSQLVDVSGDGLPDWIYSDGSQTYALLNTGTGWETNPDPQWTFSTTTLFSNAGNYYDRGIRFLDINGDGLLDIVHSYVGYSPSPELGSYSQVFLNTSHGWATTTAYTLPAYIVTGNANSSFTHNEYANWIGNGQMAQDVISTITYPKGGSSSVAYTNSTAAVNPSLPYEILTVSSVINHNGSGSNEATDYSYNAGLQYLPSTIIDRKFAGFATSTETRGDRTVISYFNQGDATSTSLGEQSDGYAQINRPYRIDIKSPSGTLLQQTFNRWDATPHGNVYFLALGRQVIQSYASDTTHRDTATEYEYSTTTDDLLEVDQYGEVTGDSYGSFTDTGTDGRATVYTYAAATSTNLSLPIEKKIALLVASGTTTTANFYTAAGDGSMDDWDTFAAAHAASTANDNLDTNAIVQGTTLWTNGSLWSISRTFLPFDTTDIPAGATINNATLYLRGFTYVHGGNIALVPSTQASTSVLTLADYGRVSFTRLATDKDTSAFGAYPGSMQSWSISTSAVQPAGYSKLAIVATDDFNNTDPGPASGNNWGLANIYTSRAGSDLPYLAITYSTGGGGTAGTTVADTKLYYDNLAFGSVSTGNQTRQENWKSGSSYASSTAGYNSYGLVASSTDRNGKTTFFGYDAYNLYPASTTNPLGHNTQQTFNYANGQVVQTTDPNGHLTKKLYDGVGRVIEQQQSDVTTPASLVTATTYTYTDNSTPPSIVKRSDYLTATTTVDSYTFTDGLGREIQKRAQHNTGSYAVSDKTYDSAGQLHSSSLPYFSSGTAYTSPSTTTALYTTFTYDALARQTNATNAVGSTTNAFSKWTTNITDANGHIKDFTKDAFGNLVQVIEHASSNYTTSYGYDALDNLASTTDALGNVRAFTYDGLSRRLTATDLHAPADGTFGAYTYTYDDNSNLTSVVDPKSQTINRTYDALNRILTEDYTGAAGTEATFTYDSCTYGIGLLCTASSTAAKTTNSFDILGRVSAATTTIGGTTYATSQLFDRQGNVTQQTYPSGSRVTYTFGTGGKVNAITRAPVSGSPTDLASSITYAETGAPSIIDFGNGVQTTRIYSPSSLYRLSNLITVPPEGESMMAGGGEGEQSMMRAAAPAQPQEKSAATLKGETVAAALAATTTARSRYTIEIVSTEPIKDGIQVFARAWDKGQQIGFGTDGSVDIERFRIFNPPLLVEDDKGPITRTFYSISPKTNKPTKVIKHFREDPKEALLQVIEHDLSVMNVHGAEAIIAGKVGRTTDTYYAGSGNGGVGYDITGGYTQGSWDSLHDAATGNVAEYAQTSSNALYSPGRWSNATVVQLSRTFYPIDTSALGADQVVTNATWSVYVTDHYSASVPGGAPMAWSLAQGTQAATSSLTTADFDAWGSTRLASDIANSSITDNAYNTWTFNADGRAAVNTTGTTKLAMLASHDIDDYFTTSQNWVTRLLVRYADYTGTSYDPKLVVEHQTGTAATTTIQNIAYLYDAVGNITSLADTGGTNAQHAATYGYDALDRLTAASTTAASTTPYRLSFAYDALGSITGTSLNGGATTTYTYAGTGNANPHAVTTYGSTGYTYDNNGNVSAAGSSSYTYDYLNRITQSVVAGATTTYGYDVSGSRMYQTVGSTTTRYPSRLYSIASFADGATTTATSTEYVFLGDMLIATVDQALVNGSATGTPTTSYIHPDHLNSTAVTTDVIAAVTQALDYYPYGASRVSTGSSANKRQYIGEFADGSGLSYLNARYYEANRGQFLSQDPLFLGDPKGQMLTDPQSLNSYSYAGDNPITRSDPTGKFWWKEFYTNWNGYCVTCMSRDNGLILKAGEVFGGRFAAQDAIAANSSNIAASAAQSGVSPSMYQAIMYEENSHQFPPFGGERAIENICPGCVSGGIGVMQVSAGSSKLSNGALLNDKTNVNAAGGILSGLQSQYGSNPSILGAYYNNGQYGPASTHAANYGQRVNSYTSSNLSPTFGDMAVRGVSSGISGVLSSLSAALSTLSSVLKSMSK